VRVELEPLFAVLEPSRAEAVTFGPGGRLTPLAKCLAGRWYFVESVEPNPIEGVESCPLLEDMPRVSEVWQKEGEGWVAKKNAEGKYQGRNGYEARRLLRKVGTWIHHYPTAVTPEDLYIIAERVGPAPKTKRAVFAILGSFLDSKGNRVVQRSHVKDRYPNRAMNTPVIDRDARDKISNGAQGIERVILALLGCGRRPVEIRRAMLSDLHLRDPVPWIGVRKKGGHGDPNGRMALNSSVIAELAWWLPLRATWAARSSDDTGHLVCRQDGSRLVGVSIQYLRRAKDAAARRAGVGHYPLYAFRRGAATLAFELTGNWDDVAEVLQDSDSSVVRGYVQSLLVQRRAPGVMELLAVRPPVGAL